MTDGARSIGDAAPPRPGTILDLFRLDDRVAVVTGASSGLGQQCAVSLAEAGADIVLAARRVERLRETVAKVEATGRKAVVSTTDVTDPEACERAAESAVDVFGRLDVLVNCAGTGGFAPATRESPEHWRSIIDINLSGAYWMTQSCARRMTSGGSVVNIGSVLGFSTARLPQAAYSASKSALVGLTRDLAQQWSGRKGIRVNTVAPGYFPSEMTRGMDEEYRDYLTGQRIPMGRLGRLDECAACVVFLAGDGASYVTGSVLTVDGGFLTT